MSSKNKIYLVTGCGKGIGRAISLEIAKRSKEFSATVLVGVSRTKADLDNLGKEISAISANMKFVPRVADVSVPKNIDGVLDELNSTIGFPTDVVLNAGCGVFKVPGEFTEADYDHVFNLNVRGTFWLAQRAFAEFKKWGAEKAFGSSLSFVTSTAAEKAYDQSLIYCASKYAQKGLVEVLRLHARPLGVRVLNLMPGPVFTPMWGKEGIEIREKMLEPESVAEVLVSALLQPSKTCVEEIQIRPVWGDFQSP